MPDPTQDHFIISGELGMLDELLPLIADKHLLELRALLKHSGKWAGSMPSQDHRRVLLLDRTCKRIVAAGLASETYLVGCGDMLPTTVPDDASSLTE